MTVQSVEGFLKEIGLQQYAVNISSNDIDYNMLHTMNDKDLQKIGILSLGHRRTILMALNDHQNQDKHKDEMRVFSQFKRRYYIVYFLIPALLVIASRNKTELMIFAGVWLFVFPIYMYPTYMAWKKGHPSKMTITIINILFGVSFIGWIIALVFSMRLVSEKEAVALAVLAPNRGLKK